MEKECKEYSGVYKGRVLEEYKTVQWSTRRQYSGVQEGSTMEYTEGSTAVYREEYSGECTAQFGEIKVNLVNQ